MGGSTFDEPHNLWRTHEPPFLIPKGREKQMRVCGHHHHCVQSIVTPLPQATLEDPIAGPRRNSHRLNVQDVTKTGRLSLSMCGSYVDRSTCDQDTPILDKYREEPISDGVTIIGRLRSRKLKCSCWCGCAPGNSSSPDGAKAPSPHERTN